MKYKGGKYHPNETGFFVSLESWDLDTHNDVANAVVKQEEKIRIYRVKDPRFLAIDIKGMSQCIIIDRKDFIRAGKAFEI